MDGFAIPERLVGVSPIADSRANDDGRERRRKAQAPLPRETDDGEPSIGDEGPSTLNEIA